VIKLIVALLFIGLNLYTYRFLASDDYIPPREDFSSFPMNVSGWECDGSEVMEDNILDRLGVTDYLICTYVKRKSEDDGERPAVVGFYTGYHATQTRSSDGGETIIHPPEHCLPGAGWDIIDSQIVPVEFGGTTGEAKRVVIAKGNLRSLVYFWYQSRGRVIARNHEKVLYMFMDRALDRRTDGSLVRFTIPINHGNEALAEENFRSLAQALSPVIPEYLPN
jgi:EpsI family protein